MMEADQNIESDVFRKADFGLRISEKISTISKDLAVVTKLRTLKNISANSAIDETLFEDSDREVLVKLAVKLTNQLTDVKVLLNESRSVLEGIETAPVSAPSPQISSQMTDLQVKLDEFKAYTPPPPVIDYALLASQLPKELSRSSAMNSQYSEKQEKELAEIEARSRNIMIYNCVITNKEYSAKEAASHYLFGSTIPSFMNAWQKVKDAKFVKVAEDGKTGTVCATMTSPLVVNTILKDAKLRRIGLVRIMNGRTMMRTLHISGVVVSLQLIGHLRSKKNVGSWWKNRRSRLPQSRGRSGLLIVLIELFQWETSKLNEHFFLFPFLGSQLLYFIFTLYFF